MNGRKNSWQSEIGTKKSAEIIAVIQHCTLEMLGKKKKKRCEIKTDSRTRIGSASKNSSENRKEKWNPWKSIWAFALCEVCTFKIGTSVPVCSSVGFLQRDVASFRSHYNTLQWPTSASFTTCLLVSLSNIHHLKYFTESGHNFRRVGRAFQSVDLFYVGHFSKNLARLQISRNTEWYNY